MNSISMRELSYRYPDGTLALDRVTVEIPLNQRTVLLGANGSGKSTLLRHINGLLIAQSGELAVKNQTINKKNADIIRKKVGLLFDNPDNQIFSPTVEADVEFGPVNLRMMPDEIKKRALNAMEEVNILDLRDKSPYNLSLGQKKRCAIAGVLAMNPEILLMDEPFSGLDPGSLKQFLVTLDTLYQRGMTQVMSTHDVDLAYEWADYVIVMSQGRILKEGDYRIMQNRKLMDEANLALPVLVQLFEGKRKIPKNVHEAKKMIEDKTTDN